MRNKANIYKINTSGIRMEKEKKYPEDYTEEQREMIKEIVIARLERLPDNIKISIG